MIYKVKSGARLPVSAQVAGEECERLESSGGLTPANLVNASRPDDAPLHGCFEWDDSVAAEKYRERQASYIIRSIEVSVGRSSEPVRAFVPVASDNSREFRSIGVVLRSSDSRDALLDSAKRELMAFVRKYRALNELSDVFAAIEETVGTQQTLELAG